MPKHSPSEAAKISRCIDRYSLLFYPNFLDDVTCREVIQKAQLSESSPATVYGSGKADSINAHARKASRLVMPVSTTGLVHRRLMEQKQSIEQHFSISLRDCEEPQFLRYDVGDFFVAHQDGNTGLVRLKSDAERRVSVIILLNRQSEESEEPGTYSGGSLKFSNYREEPEYREFCVPLDAGTLLAFRSELTHEVLPVTHGKRYSIVSWYR
jgi:SM-20-related protein